MTLGESLAEMRWREGGGGLGAHSLLSPKLLPHIRDEVPLFISSALCLDHDIASLGGDPRRPSIRGSE